MEEFVWYESDLEDDWQAPEWLLTPAGRRRLKALMVLVAVWGVVYGLHVVEWGQWAVIGLSLLILIYITWLFQAETDPVPVLSLSEPGIPTLPTVTLMIPAKNEAAVLPGLIASVAALDYPHLDVWVIDDASTDATPQVLASLQAQYPWLQVHRRAEGAGGGKSGALNEVLPLTHGAVIAVFDADAHLPSDLLQRSLPLLYASRKVGAVQVRKAVANQATNAWTQGQAAEMTLDAFFQQQRTTVGGVGELRGNGQLIHRRLLLRCGGWNEGTVTDDLDLSFKVHLAGAEIAFLTEPPVWEEGVTSWDRLWHQRCRWAEGGYQRFLDYWPGLFAGQLSWLKRLDLGVFFLNQYLLPMALVPDLVWAWRLEQHTVLWPLGVVAYLTIVWGLWCGQRQSTTLSGLALWRSMGLALVYMLHWLPVMISTTARMCIQPKRLRWVKTEHQGHAPVS
ncbi:MAG: glycosyltransferase family 2 protein [Synechococcales cyanobacterium]